jgi:AraC-type DNA-binding domain-containing proteins
MISEFRRVMMIASERLGIFIRKIRKSIFTKILLSFLLILLLPISAGSLFYKSIEKSIIESTDKYNQAMLEQLADSVDSGIEKTEMLSNYISTIPELTEFMSFKTPEDVGSQYDYLALLNDLSQFRDFISSSNSNEIIQNYYVYLKTLDIIIAPTIKTEPKLFFDWYYKYTDHTYNWYLDNVLKGYHFNEFLKSTNVKSGNSNYSIVTYVHSLPIIDKDDYKAQIVILLNNDYIMELSNRIEYVNKGCFYLIDDKNNIITSNSSEYNPEVKSIMAGNPGNGINRYMFNGKDVMTVVYNSNKTRWKYVSVIDTGIFMSKVRALKTFSFWLLLLYSISGVIVSYILASRNYMPIKDIVRSIHQGSLTMAEKLTNEFDIIKNTILNDKIEKDILKKKITEQIPVARTLFFTKLLKGFINMDEISPDSLAFMQINFRFDLYMVVIIDIENSNDMAVSDSESKRSLLRIAISNICEEIINNENNAACYILELDKNSLAVLINANESYMSGIKNVMSNINHTIEDQLGIFTHTYISSDKKGIENVSKCYTEALASQDYKMIRKHNIITYNELEDIEKYYYPIETEMQLINLVKSGDYKGAERVLDKIYEENFKLHSIKPELGKYLFNNLISTVFKIINSININYEYLFDEKSNPLNIMSQGDISEDAFKNIKYSYEVICNFIRINTSCNYNHLINEVSTYILNNYSDYMLSLTTISEKFNITPQYLSTLFKKQKGKNLTDYISELRLEEAKCLLKNHSLSIVQISKLVGYSTDVPLTRLFKKYEGITPGQYRSNLQR